MLEFELQLVGWLHSEAVTMQKSFNARTPGPRRRKGFEDLCLHLCPAIPKESHTLSKTFDHGWTQMNTDLKGQHLQWKYLSVFIRGYEFWLRLRLCA
jgi:hypothetical protein